MADEEKFLLFGAEFDGQNLNKGIEEVLDSLDKARQAEELLKESIKETTAAMKANRKEAEALAKSKPLDPALIEKQTQKMNQLNAEYDEFVAHNNDLKVGLKKVNDVTKDHLKVQNQQKKNAEEINKAVSKFTNVNALAADGIKKFGNYAKDAAFGIVSGFAGGIVASVIPAIVDWIGGMSEASKELTELEKKQKIVNGVLSEAAKSAGDDIARLSVIKKSLNDTNLSAKERIEIAKAYNKTADETNKIDLKQIDNLELINQKIEAQNNLILQRAISTAALAKLTEASTAYVDAQLQLDEELKRTRLNEDAVNKKSFQVINQQIDARDRNTQSLDNYTRIQTQSSRQLGIALSKEEKSVAGLILTRDKAKRQLDEMGALLSGLITPEGLTIPGGPPKAQKTIENVFEQKLLELRARLAATASSVFESEMLISKKFAAQLEKEYAEIGRLLKDKKLTIDQADILNGLLKQINDADLSKGLEEFRKKRADALKKVNDEIINLQIENETKRINNLKDEFERERALVQTNYEQSVQQINTRSEAFRKAVDEDTKKGLISPALAKRKKFIASLLFGGLLDEAEKARMNADVDLAFKQFQQTLQKSNQGFADKLLQENELNTQAIRQATALFLEGRITYEAYQKKLTEILKKESGDRRKIQLQEAQTGLMLIQQQIAATSDPAQLKQLEAQRDALRAQISSLQREILTGAASEENDKEKERLDKLVEYANAVQGLAQSVVSFWQQVNQAEAAALDRSIALQNKRVENARDLAEKGNAEYLELEQKRLDELTRKREENARKQLAINNALTASQAIVAAITAIAQAVQTGSPVAAIAAVAAVIGAIGSAYAFVNSLQPQEPGFFHGTEYVEGKGAPAGRDKVRARLHVGERVVTAKENQDYWDTLSAIHNRTIPPDALNSFVENYPKHNLPLVDFERLSVATDGKVGADSSELLDLVGKLNGTMEAVVDGLSEIGVNVKMDQEGFEVGFSKARKRRLLHYRS